MEFTIAGLGETCRALPGLADDAPNDFRMREACPFLARATGRISFAYKATQEAAGNESENSNSIRCRNHRHPSLKGLPQREKRVLYGGIILGMASSSVSYSAMMRLGVTIQTMLSNTVGQHP